MRWWSWVNVQHGIALSFEMKIVLSETIFHDDGADNFAWENESVESCLVPSTIVGRKKWLVCAVVN